ncbi:uncharacterized protein LOC129594523 [Paramacrobiotus metropolitanus]|uniref:uncharacterized protein LOC129594523 n=1 Tax=Paramacrobiotus metropolitanus TaxID=2943436 RepID=UPI002445FC6B|nr:uncharacterized protein LOC129594523 [Paramacrobiotus metropolitanus]
MSVSHFFYGFQNPHHASSATFQWIRLIFLFGCFTVLLALLDIASDVFFIINLWWENKCAIAVVWLFFITAVPFFPVLFSAVKGRFATHQHWAKAASLNWRLARQNLIKSEDHLLVTKDGERIRAGETLPFEQCCHPVFACILDIFPVTFINRCVSYVRAWRNSGELTNHYSYSKDIEFQDLQVQKAQLTEIKYESNPQLIILLILTGTGLFPWGKAIITAALSFLSIAKYFPFCAALPGKCAFNNKIFLEKDSVDVSTANQLLKPHFAAFCGWITNFFYIVCRYHILISLTVFNWTASLLVIIIQTAIITGFLSFSYRRKYSTLENMGKAWKRSAGTICAFISQLLTTLGYFLLVPVTTTMTMRGCVLATILQGVAIAVYAIATHLDWRNGIRCNGGSAFVIPPKSAMYWALLAGNIVGSLFLPFLHYLIGLCTDKSFWLSHREKCSQCSDFKDRYCHYRPCWLCEWAWCDEQNPDQAQLIITRTPVPFLEKSLLTDKSQEIVAILATLGGEEDSDFLLCKEHTASLNQLRPPRPIESNPVVMTDIGIRSVAVEPNRNVVELFHPTSPELADFKADLHTSLHAFLRELYSLNSNDRLIKQIPYQIFYKSKLYDHGIKKRKDQDAYWVEIKELRRKHAACGKQCLLKDCISAGSKKLKLTIEPRNLPAFEWRLDKFATSNAANGSATTAEMENGATATEDKPDEMELNPTGNNKEVASGEKENKATNVIQKVVPDEMEYAFFSEANVLLLDSTEIHEPVQECPLKSEQPERRYYTVIENDAPV